MAAIGATVVALTIIAILAPTLWLLVAAHLPPSVAVGQSFLPDRGGMSRSR